jgi:hypothetical protein
MFANISVIVRPSDPPISTPRPHALHPKTLGVCQRSNPRTVPEGVWGPNWRSCGGRKGCGASRSWRAEDWGCTSGGRGSQRHVLWIYVSWKVRPVGMMRGSVGGILGNTRLPPSPLAPSREDLRHGIDCSTYLQNESLGPKRQKKSTATYKFEFLAPVMDLSSQRTRSS